MTASPTRRSDTQRSNETPQTFAELYDYPELLGKRILVVEDDEICSALAKGILEDVGCFVDVAHTPQMASMLLNENKPDLLLMDVHLGSANGIQLIAALRRGSLCPELPVIIVTSDRARCTLSEAIDFTIQGYVLKPYDTRFLMSKMDEVLRKSREERQ